MCFFLGGGGVKIATKIIIDFADLNISINCGQFAKQIDHNCSICCVCVCGCWNRNTRAFCFQMFAWGFSSTPEWSKMNANVAMKI